MALPSLPPDLLRRTERFIPAILALVMGLVALLWARQYIAEQLAKERQSLEAERQRILAEYPIPIEVVVAAQDLPTGTTLEAVHLQMGQIPERFVQPYAARALTEVLGLVTIAPLASGEQVLLNKARRADEVPAGATLSNIVPKGKRAVTIVVDIITGVGGFVRPGDIVDIVWTITIPGPEGSAPQPLTLTLFQDVPVMAIDRELPGRQTAGSAEGGEAVVPQGEYTVTLALAPQEVSFLLFAREQGRIQLSLRPHNEAGSQVATVPVNLNTLLGATLGLEAMPQAPAAPIRREIELYRGLSRDVVVLSDPPMQEAPPPTSETTQAQEP